MRLLALAAPVLAFVFPLLAQQRLSGTASLQGTVIHDGSGRPLPRTRLVLKKLEAKEAETTVTGEEGKFRFENLGAGVYTLTASRTGYLATSTVQAEKRNTQSITIWRMGQQVTDLTVRLKPGGVIAGRVRYRDGEPAIGVPVQIFYRADVRGRRSYRPAGTAITNDLGEYRLHSLAPGSYYVMAHLEAADTGDGKDQPPPEQAVTTFYPSGTQFANATAVRLAPAGEVTGCDIALAQSRTYIVSGRIVSGQSGQIIATPGVLLRWMDGTQSGTVAAVQAISNKGSFRAAGVSPGTYLIVIESSEEGRRLSARQTVTVTDTSLDLEVLAGQARKWTGSVRFDQRADFDVSALRVRLEPRSDTASPLVVNLSAEGAFEAELVPDETYDMFIENAPADVYLKSAVVAGAETIGTGFKAPRAADVRKMELTAAVQGGSVSGQAHTLDGGAASTAFVFLLPQPLEGRVQYVASSISDDSGNFVVRGVAPGRYLAVAWPSDTWCSPYDPETPPDCTLGGQPVSISQGDISGIQIRTVR